MSDRCGAELCPGRVYRPGMESAYLAILVATFVALGGLSVYVLVKLFADDR